MMVSADQTRNLILHLLSNMLKLLIQLATENFGGVIVICRVQGVPFPAVAELKEQLSPEVEQQCGTQENSLGWE